MKEYTTTLTIKIKKKWKASTEEQIIRDAVSEINEFNDIIYSMVKNEFGNLRITAKESDHDMYAKEFSCTDIDEFFIKYRNVMGGYDMVKMMNEYGQVIDIKSDTTATEIPEEK